VVEWSEEAVVRDVKVSGGTEKFRTDVSIGSHTLVIDEPDADGGKDLGPTPKEALLAALGACTSITVRMYAARKGIKLEHVDVVLSLELAPGTRARIKKTVTLAGELSADERTRLLQIAERCPINRMLVEGVEVVAHGAPGVRSSASAASS
jgi:putative redox protein